VLGEDGGRPSGWVKEHKKVTMRCRSTFPKKIGVGERGLGWRLQNQEERQTIYQPHISKGGGNQKAKSSK